MKIKINLIVFFLTTASFVGLCQSPMQNKIANQFQKNYNEKDFEGIFNMFSNAMKEHLPLNKTNDFFNGIYKANQQIESLDYSRSENGGAVYLAGFESKNKYEILLVSNSSGEIAGLLVRPPQVVRSAKKDRNTSSLALPFSDEWYTFWGGDNEEDNYHVVDRAQKHAFDFVIRKDGKSYSGNGMKNKDYYAFGEEILAASDGEIVMVVDGIPDNTPGKMNPTYVPGNTVIVKANENEYHFYAHFQKGSIKVKEGDLIKQGDVLGLCGNSGNSSEPHLHFHIQDGLNMYESIGVKAYFDALKIDDTMKKDYSPTKGEYVSNQ